MTNEQILQECIEYILSCRPSWYAPWWSGPLSDRSPAWAVNKPPPPPGEVNVEGLFCAAVPNLMIRKAQTLGSKMKIPNPFRDEEWDGGTLAYYEWFYDHSEWFKPGKNYRDGCLLLSPYRSPEEQGHVAVVYKGYAIESITSGGLVWKYTVDQSTAWGKYEIVLPPETWLTGKAKGDEPPAKRYPGHTASAYERAQWMAAVAGEEFSLPGVLPVMCSCVELTCAWVPETEDVSECPGYGPPPLDHDSLGYFQQRPSQGWGTPEQILDPDYSLRKFLSEAKKHKGQYDSSPEGLGAWCQAVQRSGYPDAYTDKGHPMAMDILSEDVPVPGEPPPDEGSGIVWSRYNFVARFGTSSSDFMNAAVAALENSGVQAGAFNGPPNVRLCSSGAMAWNDVSRMNCLVVGREVVGDLHPDAKPGWERGNPIWGLYGETDVLTLKKVRDWSLKWIAVEEGLDFEKLKGKFENILYSLDPRYADMLAEVDGPEMPEPPDLGPPDDEPEDTLEAILRDHERRITQLEMQHLTKSEGE